MALHRGIIVNAAFVTASYRDEAGRQRVRITGIAEDPVVSRPYLHLFRQM